jgi:choice-of-anchor A domain-containing protein
MNVTSCKAIFAGLPLILIGCGANSTNGVGNKRHAAVSETGGGVSLASVVTGAMDGIRADAETHVLIVGYSNGQGDQFVRAATARAKRYRALYPNHNVIFVASPEVRGVENKDVLENLGVKTIFTSENAMSAELLKSQLGAFKQIASLDFYSHSGPEALYLSSNGGHISTNSDRTSLESLKPLFTSHAYATLNGCTAGLLLAPFLTKVWNIPVSGAAEGTNFQQLHTDGSWYFNDVGRYPTGGWAKVNKISFPSSIECRDGVCHRMKPEGFPYSFDGGNSQKLGLGFYKFFCSQDIAQDSCERSMVLSLLAQPSIEALTLGSSEEQFRAVLVDFMCPNEQDFLVRKSCVDAIHKAEVAQKMEYSSFQGRSLQCNFQGCNFDFSCKTIVENKSDVSKCSISTSDKTTPTTYMREYISYLKGFKALNKPIPVPAPTPAPVPNDICIDSPVGAATNFQVTLAGNWNASSSDIEGRAAVGGNVHLEDYSIGAKLPLNAVRNDLLVGGTLWFNRGGVPNGAVVARAIDLFDHVGVAGSAKVDATLELSDIFVSVGSLAHHVRFLSQTGQTRVDDYGIPTVGVVLVGVNSQVNVFDVSADIMARAHFLKIQQPAGATAIVRIAGKNVQLQRFATESVGTPNSRIIFAALDAESVTLSNIGFVGMLLAPAATVQFSDGLITGQVFAKNLEGNGQININQFDGCVPSKQQKK